MKSSSTSERPLDTTVVGRPQDTEPNGAGVGGTRFHHVGQTTTPEFRNPDQPTKEVNVELLTTRRGPQGEATPSTSYVRVCELAKGGMGRVDLALRHEGNFRRLYAVKRLHPHLRDDADFRAMFLDEARVAGLLHHANVVSVLDIGDDEEGPFLVMDFIDGLSLDRLQYLVEEDGEPMPLQLCVRIAIGMARGLHAAHQLRDHDGQLLHLVHRDLSPHNVLLGYDGTVRITDFGIAKALGQSTKTATGVIKGKMAYLSPEQLRFEEPDARSDLFALGIILYELLTGDRLYTSQGGGTDGARRILNEPPPDAGEQRPETPVGVTELLFQLLAKERELRPESAEVVALRLERALGELLADEEPLDLSAYLRELAVGSAEERREIAEAIERVEALSAPSVRLRPNSSVSPDIPVVVDLDEGTTEIMPSPPQEMRRPWRGRAIGAGVIALLCAGALVWLPQLSGEGTEDSVALRGVQHKNVLPARSNVATEPEAAAIGAAPGGGGAGPMASEPAVADEGPSASEASPDSVEAERPRTDSAVARRRAARRRAARLRRMREDQQSGATMEPSERREAAPFGPSMNDAREWTSW